MCRSAQLATVAGTCWRGRPWSASARRVPSATLVILALAGATAKSADDPNAPANARHDIYGDPLPEGATARLGTVRYRACSGSGRIEFLPDGRTLLGCHGTRVVWLDVPTGRVTRAIELEADTATLLAVTRDRTAAAVLMSRNLRDVGDREHQIILLDTATGAERARQPMQTSWRKQPQAAAFSPDATRLITGDYEGVLHVIDLATWRDERTKATPTPREVRSIACSPDGQWVVVTNYDQAWRWEWQRDAEMQQIGPAVQRVLTAEFAPDSRLFALGEDFGQGIRLFDVESGRPVRQLLAEGRYHYPEQLAFTSDGATLALPTQRPPGLDVWDVSAGKLLQSLPSPGKLRRAAVSADKRWIAATDYEGTITAWEFESGQRVGDEFRGHRQPFQEVIVSPGGKEVLTGGNDGDAIVWEIATGRPIHVLRHEADRMVRGLAFSPDGGWIATSALDDTVVLWDRASGERVRTLFGHGNLGGRRMLRFTPDSGTLLSFGDDWFLRAFDVQTGKAVLEHAIRPTGVTLKESTDGSVDKSHDDFMFDSMASGEFTPDGATLALVVARQGYLFDVQSGVERARYDVGTSITHSTVLSPDGIWLATVEIEAPVQERAPRKYRLQVRRVADGEVTASWPLPDAWSAALAFSPDGSKFGMAHQSIHVYDTATGRELARIEPDVGAAHGLTFSPDGERLVVCHADTTALVWDWQRFLISEEAGK